MKNNLKYNKNYFILIIILTILLSFFCLFNIFIQIYNDKHISNSWESISLESNNIEQEINTLNNFLKINKVIYFIILRIYIPITTFIKKIEDFAKEYGMFGEIKTGLGGTKSIIENCNLRIYFSNKKCSLTQAMKALDILMYGGDLKTRVENEGYS